MADPRFLALIQKMRDTHEAKNSDYADSETDPWLNFRRCELAGIPAFDGCLTRLSDKFHRVMNLRRKEREGREAGVKSEAITDTLIDMANYALIALLLYQDMTAGEQPGPELLIIDRSTEQLVRPLGANVTAGAMGNLPPIGACHGDTGEAAINAALDALTDRSPNWDERNMRAVQTLRLATNELLARRNGSNS